MAWPSAFPARQFSFQDSANVADEDPENTYTHTHTHNTTVIVNGNSKLLPSVTK